MIWRLCHLIFHIRRKDLDVDFLWVRTGIAAHPIITLECSFVHATRRLSSEAHCLVVRQFVIFDRILILILKRLIVVDVVLTAFLAH